MSICPNTLSERGTGLPVGGASEREWVALVGEKDKDQSIYSVLNNCKRDELVCAALWKIIKAHGALFPPAMSVRYNDNTKDQSLCYKISGVATDNLEPQSTQQDVVNEKVTWSEHMIISQMRPGGNNDNTKDQSLCYKISGVATDNLEPQSTQQDVVNEKVTWSEHMIISQMRPGGNNDNTKDQSLCYKISGVATDNLEPQSTQQDVMNEKVTWSEHMIVSQMRPGGNNDNTKDQSLCYKISGVATDNLEPQSTQQDVVNEKVTWSEHMIVSQMRPGGNNDNTKDQSLCYKISGVATDNLEPQSTQQDVVNEKVTWSEHMIVSQMRPGGNNDNTKDQSLCYKISGVATDNLEPQSTQQDVVNEKVTWSEHMIVSQMRPGGNNDNTKDQSLCYKISGVATDNLEPQSTQQDVVNEKVTWSEHMIVSQMRPGGNNDNTKDQSLCYKISGVATDNLEPQSTQQDVVNEKVTWSEHMIVSQMRPGGNNDNTKDQSLCYKISGVATDNLEPQSTQQDVVNEKVTWSEHMIISQMRPGGNNDNTKDQSLCYKISGVATDNLEPQSTQQDVVNEKVTWSEHMIVSQMRPGGNNDNTKDQSLCYKISGVATDNLDLRVRNKTL
ncbi:hypothetical protein J6590_055865 [Homalodisca vitripennis]|nr:hypothetical protein J6590_055865 [Homalodisca vitripennis]